MSCWHLRGRAGHTRPEASQPFNLHVYKRGVFCVHKRAPCRRKPSTERGLCDRGNLKAIVHLVDQPETHTNTPTNTRDYVYIYTYREKPSQIKHLHSPNTSCAKQNTSRHLPKPTEASCGVAMDLMGPGQSPNQLRPLDLPPPGLTTALTQVRQKRGPT